MNSRMPKPTPPADPGFEKDLIARTFGQPQWHCDGDLLAMAFAADGTLWTVEDPGVLRRWDTAGKLLARTALDNIDSTWTFSTGARYVASASYELNVWEVASGRKTGTIGHESWFSAAAFHPTRRMVATGHADGTVRVWDLGTEELVKELAQGDQEVSALAFTSDGALLASASEGRTIAVWDLASGKLVRTLSGHTDRIPVLAWQPGSRLLVSGGWDTTARLWNIDTGEPLLLLNTHADQVYTLAFSPDGKLLACADSAASIHIWSDIAKGKELHVLPGDQEEVRCLAFTDDGKRLAVGGTDRVVHIWDPLAADLVAGHGTQAGHVIDLAPISKGLLVSTGCTSELQAWDLASGGARLPSGLVPKPLAVACSGDGLWVACTSANPESRLHIFDVAAQTLRPPAEGPRAPMTCLTFSPDSKLIATGCRSDGTAWLWTAADGEPSLIIPESTEGCTVEALAFHPAGDRLACGGIDWLATSGSDGAVTVWDIFQRVRVATFVGGAVSLAFDPAGDYLAVASPDSTIIIWDVAGKRQAHEIAGPGTRIAAVGFTPDGRYLAAGCDDHTLRLWERKTGRSVSVHELDSPIKALHFSTDGSFLYTGNGNTTCHEIPVRRLLGS
jgi:WD40 repeat protein